MNIEMSPMFEGKEPIVNEEPYKRWKMTYYECCFIPSGSESLTLFLGSQKRIVIKKVFPFGQRTIARVPLEHVTSMVTRRAPMGWQRFLFSNAISAIVGLIVMYFNRKGDPSFYWIWFLIMYISMAVIMVTAMMLVRPLQFRLGVKGNFIADDFSIDLLPIKGHDDQEDIELAIRMAMREKK